MHAKLPTGHLLSTSANGAQVPLLKWQGPDELEAQVGHTHGVNDVGQVADEFDTNGAHKFVTNC